MAEVYQVPRIRCDNCGFADEKEPEPFAGGKYRRKEGWGGIRIDPSHRGNYPNNIAFGDLCPDCLKAVHDAVAAALSNGLEARTKLDEARMRLITESPEQRARAAQGGGNG